MYFPVLEHIEAEKKKQMYKEFLKIFVNTYVHLCALRKNEEVIEYTSFWSTLLRRLQQFVFSSGSVFIGFPDLVSRHEFSIICSTCSSLLEHLDCH